MAEVPRLNRKHTMWPRKLDVIFTFVVIGWYDLVHSLPPHVRRPSCASWVSATLHRRTGVLRSPQQVASHLQQRRRWYRQAYGSGVSWDTFICSQAAFRDYLEEEDDDVDEADVTKDGWLSMFNKFPASALSEPSPIAFDGKVPAAPTGRGMALGPSLLD
ncbi:hypothetical protein AURDEDRAFT_175363 [Auricularia subglabra TFB-10046 SS5]|uniref:Uncharacterized protein n=1 Tax=Auricularia subglabra (strain TFB-10046 / SS5) TaxID=717982 RepID=J0WS01_AURST|nr:hypothetical protein AURDEDRAFT_175363 [Auricularia subglabra TFB-10046 SS5]